jgi:hypothetical protein
MKLLSFDVESNGLHGASFAVAALLMDSQLKVLDEFQGRCPLRGQVDPWVKDNVLPPMQGMAVNYLSARTMRTEFWKWYLTARIDATHVLSDNPYPVEARFLIACQQDDLQARYFEHPFPLLDLGTMLYREGADTAAKRHAIKQSAIEAAGVDMSQALVHNPRWDAWATAVTALRLLGAD